MRMVNPRSSSLAFSLILTLVFASYAYAAGPLLIAYGGHNETMAPLWVGIEKGLFRKHGLRSQSAPDPQRSDHDGDACVRRGSLGLGGAEQRLERHGRRHETRLLCRRQQQDAP